MLNCKHCQELLRRNVNLRDALEFYAELKYYRPDPELDRRKVDIDKGERARRALDGPGL